MVLAIVVFGVVAWFLFRTAAEYDANKRGLDGALQKVAAAPYGEWLLGAVAAGLFAYGGQLRRTVAVLVQEVLLEPVGR